MSRLAAALAMAGAVAAAPFAHAEVSAVTEQGFDVRHEERVPVAPAEAYRRFADIARWWDPDHTYSGEASNLWLAAQPGGCWCERLPEGGFVEHMHVIFAAPGALLRLRGGLGPLQDSGASGAMTIAFAEDGTGARVTLVYRVRGLSPADAQAWSGPVDGVLGAGLARFAAVGSAP